MLYEAKKGSKAYDYIKGILEAEEKEYQAYMKSSKAFSKTEVFIKNK